VLSKEGPQDKPNDEVRYGAKDSIRLDVYNKINDTTLCIDDIKTLQRGLSFKRMRELATTVRKTYAGIERIIVTEVRPKGLRPPRPRPPTLRGD